MFKLLTNKPLRFLIFSNTISQFGDRLTHMVVVGLIGVLSPGRVGAFSEFATTFTIPIIFLSPFAGILIDHWNKRNIMIRCHWIQAGLILITPIFVYYFLALWPVFLTVMIFFSLDLFNNVSRLSVTPEVVAKDDLMRANSLITSFARLATFAGMIGGGYLAKLIRLDVGMLILMIPFTINALSHFTAGSFIIGMGKKERFEPKTRLGISLHQALRDNAQKFFSDLKELLILVIKDRIVAFVMLTVIVIPATSALAYTVMIYIVQQELNLGTAGVGLMGGLIGGGMLIGALILGSLKKRFNRGTVIIGVIIFFALLLITGRFLIVFSLKYLLAIVSILIGIAFSLLSITQDTMLQEDVKKTITGRIFATKEFIVNVSFIISAFLFGYLSDYIGYLKVLIGAGVGLIVLAILALRLWPSRGLTVKTNTL